jgi:hypothetical protein
MQKNRSCYIPILETLGGEREVAKMLRARKFRIVALSAVRMWKYENRKGIPGDAMRELMTIAEERGLAYRRADFEPVRK